MKDYDYYRDTWPQIVRDTFAHGGRMFAVTTQYDDAGHIAAYVQGCELSEAAVLEFRGATVTVYENNNTAKENHD